MSDKPNGIGDWLIVGYLSLISGFFKFGFEWYGLKALLNCWIIIIGYAAIKWIVFEIIDFFKRN